jgi:hypothetical protein
MRLGHLVSLAVLLLLALSSSLPAYAAKMLGPECY